MIANNNVNEVRAYWSLEREITQLEQVETIFSAFTCSFMSLNLLLRIWSLPGSSCWSWNHKIYHRTYLQYTAPRCPNCKSTIPPPYAYPPLQCTLPPRCHHYTSTTCNGHYTPMYVTFTTHLLYGHVTPYPHLGSMFPPLHVTPLKPHFPSAFIPFTTRLFLIYVPSMPPLTIPPVSPRRPTFPPL